jgi:hypothetical protein
MGPRTHKKWKFLTPYKFEKFKGGGAKGSAPFQKCCGCLFRCGLSVCGVCEILPISRHQAEHYAKYFDNVASPKGFWLKRTCTVCGGELKRQSQKKVCSKQCFGVLIGKSNARKKIYAGDTRSERARISYHVRCAADPLYKLKHTLRRNTWRIFRLSGKKTNTQELIGVSFPEAKQIIERKFKRGMTWENYGKVWHIDHVIPLSHFDLSDEAQVKRANHIYNLQPLFAFDNLSKNNRFSGAHQVPLI